MEPRDVLLESLPDDVIASLEVRDAWRRQVAADDVGLEFIVSDLARWEPGSTVRVAFLDGDTQLHADIASATKQITDACNLTLDFGLDAATGRYRTWTEQDTEYAAEIRVRFDIPGFASLVGTDSTDPTIGQANAKMGGRPGQGSLKLGGFTTHRPQHWQGTVRHEFMHAVAFHHEHQNLRGPCEKSFRWEDEPGYQLTQNADGVSITDSAGRRPGIYTYLAGEPNRWSRSMVDHNLRTVNNPDLVAGPFDNASVMLYRFKPLFYTTDPSPCAPSGDGIDLSDGDKRGLRLLYPDAPHHIADRASRALDLIGNHEVSTLGGTPHVDRVVELLNGLAGVSA